MLCFDFDKEMNIVRQNRISFGGLSAIIFGFQFAVFLLIYVFRALTWPAPSLVASFVVGGTFLAYLAFILQTRLVNSGFYKIGLVSRRRTLVFGVIALLILAFYLSFFPQPAFQTVHSLEICATKTSADNPFVIQLIKREDGSLVGLSTIKGNDPWNLASSGLVAQANGACAQSEGFFLGGIYVYLRASPNQGLAKLTWDGYVQLINLDSQQEGVVRVDLPGSTFGRTSILRATAAWSGKFARLFILFGGAILIGFWLARAARPLFVDGWLYRALVVVSILGLVALSQFGQLSAQVADDFCAVSQIRNSNIFQGTWNWYTGVNGRIGEAFLDMVNASIFPVAPFPWAIFLIIFIWLGLVVFALRNLFRWLLNKPPGFMVLLIGASTLMVTLVVTPDLFQSLFWSSGRIPLVTPLLFFTLILGCFPALLHANRLPLKLSGMAFLSMITGFFHEAFAASQVTLWIAILGCVYLAQRYARFRIPPHFWSVGFSALVGAAIGLGVNFFSPGTAERSSALGTHLALGNLIIGAVQNTGQFIFYQMFNAPMFALFTIALFMGLYFGDKQYKKRTLFSVWVSLPVVLYVVSLAAFAVSQYGLGGALPERTQLILVYLFSLFVISWGTVTGALISVRISGRETRNIIFIIHVLACLLLIFSFVSQAYYLLNYRPKLDRYANAVRIFWSEVRIAHQEGASRLVAERLPPNPFGLTDPSPDKSTFVDRCIDSAAGLSVEFH